ncbi:MAG TPA: type II secretion system F family protein [Phycisphaerae bacterium]|nr:type II secretion system F family protein [Phycisphaerae bacterium]
MMNDYLWASLMIVFILIAAGVVAVFVRLLFRAARGLLLPKVSERIVVGQLAAIVRQNLPLATAVALAAKSEKGLSRLYLQRIATLLSQGLPLSEAVSKSMTICSPPTLPLILAGERTGRLAAALDQAEANLIDTTRRVRHQPLLPVPYLIVMAGLTITITAGIMVAVVPKFQEIFKDFGTQLPGITRALIDFSKWCVQTPAWLVALIALVTGLYLSVRPRRIGRPQLTARLADHLRWNLPVLHRITYSRGLKTAFEIMRLGVGAGMDLAPAAELAARTDVNTCLRERLLRFARLIEQGTNLRQAARDARIGEVAGTALAAGQRSHDMDAALRYIIDYHDALVSRLAAVCRSLAVPLVVLVVATFAGWVTLALFLPLIALINSVAG